MKVLFITNIPSPYRVDFFNELGRHCDLTVWFEAENEANRHWGDDGKPKTYQSRFLRGWTLGLDKHVNPSIIRLLRTHSFDVTVLGGYSTPTELAAIQWLRMRRKPFLLSSDGGFPARENVWKKRFKTRFISSAAGWLSSGSNCTAYLRHYGADAGRIYEYPFSSVDYDPHSRKPMSPEEKISFKQREGLKRSVILSVGQFIDRKGYKELLQFSGALDDGNTTLLLIGGGPLKSAYEDLARQSGLSHVLIKDYMSKERLAEFYKASDLFVLPTRYDIWGLVLNEAMAFGLPIVTTTGAGAAYTLVTEGENGYIADPSDYPGIVESCRQIRDDAALRKRMSRISLERSEAYTISRMAARHLQIFGQFLQQQTNKKAADSIGQYHPV